MAFAGGEVFAGYTIVRLLGSGGMGEVYLARHPRLPREDALKILPESLTAGEEFRQRFVREADMAATLWHPHIVRAYDRGEFEGRLWIAMDYVEGTDAARLSREQFPSGMPAADVVAIVQPMAEALDYAHERGLLHRDVKPANILLTAPTKGQRRALLADFGIARHTDDVTGLTAANMTVGSVSYTAPEQLMGEELDGRVDEYALAATAFHLLTGSPPFPHSNPAVVISRHIGTPPPAPGDRKPELRTLDAVIATALAKDPADRYDSCSDFAEALAGASTPDATDAPTPQFVAPVAAEPPSPQVESPVPAAADEPTTKRAIPPTVVSSWGATEETEDDGADDVPAPPPPPPTPTAQSRSPALVAAAAVAVGLIATITFAALRTGDEQDSTPTAATPTTTQARLTQQTPPPQRLPATETVTRTAPPVTITKPAPPPPPPPSPRPPPPPAVPAGDLGLSIPMSYPKCNGQAIVILGSVTTPGQYREGVQRLLAANPGSYYLRTDLTCPSLRARNEEGNPIYAVFYLGGSTYSQLCAAVSAAGSGAYGKILDYTTDPNFIPC